MHEHKDSVIEAKDLPKIVTENYKFIQFLKWKCRKI